MLAGALGDRFAATVARGRRDYAHPEQLSAMVRAGLVSEASATWKTAPRPLPPPVESLLLEARTAEALRAAEQLPWDDAPCYYMFPRRIDRWSDATSVRAALASCGH